MVLLYCLIQKGEQKTELKPSSYKTLVIKNVQADINVVANFAKDQAKKYTIAASCANKGGTISPAGNSTVSEGSNAIYSIVPDKGYMVSNVVVDNTSVGAVYSYTFTSVKGNHAIAVAFQPVPDTTTSSASTGDTSSAKQSASTGNKASTKANSSTENTTSTKKNASTSETSAASASSSKKNAPANEATSKKENAAESNTTAKTSESAASEASSEALGLQSGNPRPAGDRDDSDFLPG